MNAKVDEDENNKLWLHNQPNRKGEYLADFSLENTLSSLNTESPPKKRKENNESTPIQITLRHR